MREEAALLTTAVSAVKPARRPQRQRTPHGTARPTPTYDRFELTSIMPAVGWQAVYVDQGAHVLGEVHALCLAYRVVREAHTGQLVRQAWRGPKAEALELVAMAYHPADGWSVVEEASNFCGLCPPGMTLAEFEACSACHYAHAAPGAEACP
jgi:hypothetical protein